MVLRQGVTAALQGRIQDFHWGGGGGGAKDYVRARTLQEQCLTSLSAGVQGPRALEALRFDSMLYRAI